jgi:GNAT superfamily N-acetyltransferase
MAAEVHIRPAVDADVELIYELIVELAVYEREPDAVVGSVSMLQTWLFGPKPAAEALIAEVDGQLAGFALFHLTFSTWECQPGIWLEDLFVRPEQRRHGLGARLLGEVAAITIERGYTRLGWAALDWNEMALGFYRKMGASMLDEWKMHRLTGAALEAVAEGGRPVS